MIKVNAIGDNCPIPVIKTKKAMQEVTGAETIEVLVDNEIAVQNVTKMASSAGASVSSEKIAEKEFKLTIQVNGAVAGEDTKVTCIPDQRGNLVIAFDSDRMGSGNDELGKVLIKGDRMGSGNDELGKVLIKGFIFAVTQLEQLPKTMLFYNGGATLTAEGSDSLEDLKSLEAQGVEILTCGTCLNYYGLTEKLQVGSVTNMYTIVEKLTEADKVVKP